MRTETIAVLTAQLNWIRKNQARAILARDKTEKKSLDNVMLSGKIKAYEDIAQLIENRWLNHEHDWKNK